MVKKRTQKIYAMKGCSKKSHSHRKGHRKSHRKSRRSRRGGSHSGCGSCGCPIAPYPITRGGKTRRGRGLKGGNCESCSLIQKTGMLGGNFYKAPAPIPGPMVGSPWGTSVHEWPGVNGISGDRNYLKSIGDVIDNDPQLQMTMDASGYVNRPNSMVGGGSIGRGPIGGYVYGKRVRSKTPRNSSTSTRSRKSRRRSGSRRKSQSRGGGLLPQDLVNLGNDMTFQLKSTYNALNGYNAPTNPLPYKDQFSDSMGSRIIV